MASHDDKIMMLVMAGSSEEATSIGKSLIERRLAACCNILPGIQSIYWWQDSISEDAEVLLLIKTKRAAEKDIIDFVKELHSYEVPEIVSLQFSNGLEKYFDWIDESVSR